MKIITLLIFISFVFALGLSIALRGVDFNDASKKDVSSDLEICIVTGCSGQICANEEVITTCEFLPHYECYRNASCELQADGSCGWTITEELEKCLGK